MEYQNISILSRNNNRACEREEATETDVNIFCQIFNIYVNVNYTIILIDFNSLKPFNRKTKALKNDTLMKLKSR